MTFRSTFLLCLTLLVIGYFTLDYVRSHLRYTFVSTSNSVFMFDDISGKLLHCDKAGCTDISSNVKLA